MPQGQGSDLRHPSDIRQLADEVIIFVLIVVLHLVVILRYPIIYGGDTIVRIVNYPRILIGYQLPLFQIFLHYTLRWFGGPVAVGVLMGTLSGLAGAGLYALTRQMTLNRSSAWISSILYASHPFILFYSLVPYQEALLLAGILWAFFYLFRAPNWSNSLLASIFLGMACLTRYEGWIAAAVAFCYRLFQSRRKEGRISWRTSVQFLALCGWAPILWMLFAGGLSPAGTFVLNIKLQLAHLYRPYFVAKSALWWTESAVVVMALLGFSITWADLRLREDRRYHFMLLFLLLYFAALIASGHGIQPDPVRLVTEREAFVPIGLLVFYAGLGGGQVSVVFKRRFEGASVLGQCVLVLALCSVAGYGLSTGLHRVARANADPELKTDYEVAQLLVQENSRALVLARPLPEDEVQNYLRRAEKASGPEGKRMAQRILSHVETSPFDYQRLLVYSWLGKDRLMAGDLLRGLGRFEIEKFIRTQRVEYLVVFSDYAPVADHENTILKLYAEGHSPEVEIRNGDKCARIFRIS